MGKDCGRRRRLPRAALSPYLLAAVAGREFVIEIVYRGG